jgi:hypothetical protein
VSRAPVVLKIVAPKHRAKRPADRCRHWRSGSQPLACLACRREPLIGGKHRAARHLSDRHEDSCSLTCAAGFEGGGNCTVYVGRHRAQGAL